MPRARHQESPLAGKFDHTDVEAEAAATPKSRKKTPPPVRIKAPRSLKSSEGKASHAVSGEINPVKSALEVQDADILESKEDDAYEEMSVTTAAPTEAEIRASLKAVKDQMPVSDAMLRGYSAAVDAEKMSEDARAEEAWKKAHPVLDEITAEAKTTVRKQREEQENKAFFEKRAAAAEKPGASGFTAKEEAWFKQGEEDEAHQMAEARATIERGGKGELMVENKGDIDANVEEASVLFKEGALSAREFSVEDYAYLLKERVRIDTELEHAGWWKARGLRKELNQILKGGYNGAPNGLEGYEHQILAAKAGDAAARQDAAEKSKPRTKKPSFWERLRMDKGR